jgi:hypothetical protein
MSQWPRALVLERLITPRVYMDAFTPRIVELIFGIYCSTGGLWHYAISPRYKTSGLQAALFLS